MRIRASILLLSALMLPMDLVGQSDTDVGALARSIAKREGYYHRGSLPQRMNNPGALVYAGQPDATRGAVGREGNVYAKFKDPESGWAALEALVRKRMASGTLNKAWRYLK